MEKLTIAIDAMGGDLGPAAIIEGAAMAMEAFPFVEPVLFGDENILREEIKKYREMKIVHAPTVIEPSESPTLAFRRKKDSSIVMGLKYVKEGNATAFVSAGSTGALLTGATVIIGRKPGIERPALGSLLPIKTAHVLLMDSGANMDCKPSYLAQFAQLGAEYMQRSTKTKSPRVGLINVGTEDEKGNAVVKEAFAMLNEATGSDFIFVGNIEGREILSGEIDVAVCDGFTGNVLLKFAEGFAKAMMSMVKDELTATTVSKMGAMLAKSGGTFSRLKKRLDYREVGGAPFLGLNHLVVKAHGSSDALAIKNAIRQCVEYQMH
jgi:glycerol-3-phosphate acyltransferase PlsX